MYSVEENVTQVLGSAIGNQRREREYFFASFRRMKDVEISLNNFRYIRECWIECCYKCYPVCFFRVTLPNKFSCLISLAF